MMNTTTPLAVTKKKISFMPNNEIKGWAKLTDGTKSNFLKPQDLLGSANTKYSKPKVEIRKSF